MLKNYDGAHKPTFRADVLPGFQVFANTFRCGNGLAAPAAKRYSIAFFVMLLLLSTSAWAQFSGSVQGSVQDSKGASVPKANITLIDTDTKVTQHASTDASGTYRFVSLAPGPYEVTAETAGFSPVRTAFTLTTDENRNVDLTLTVSGTSTTVEVTSQAPLLDTSDSRNELTLDNQALQDLPLSGRNPTSLLVLAPGVTGRGSGGAQNFNVENYVDASANGQSSNGNQYIVDGLDVTSTIRPGVLNLTPNADVTSEVSVQVNTYTVDYGRAGSIQTVLTTKSGTEAFHGLASVYYNYQGFNALGEFADPTVKVQPYHTNTLSFALGGPVLPKKQFFFFVGYEPLLSLNGSAPGNVSIEAPEFVKFAQATMPNSPEVTLLTKYPASNVRNATTSTYAGQQYGAAGSACASGAGAPGDLGAAYDNLPCNLPLFDTGSFSSPSYNNAYQYNVRIDKYFKNDRLYGQLFRDHISSGNPTPRPSSTTANEYRTFSLQFNETHTFSPNTLNEASFGYNKIEGILNTGGQFSIPVVNVNNLGTGWGPGGGFADGDFLQHSYHWRDVLSHVVGAHSLRAGFEAWHSDDVAKFGPVFEQPNFFFNDMIQLINNNPASEGGLSYDPISGKPKLDNYAYAETTFGLFVEDTWKASRRLTLNYGIRYDNFGNPYASLAGSTLSNIKLGSGSTFSQSVIGATVLPQDHVYSHDLNWAFGPRIGAAYDITGSGKWVARGGFGVYHNQITLGNSENGVRNNPPGLAIPTFLNNGSTAAPIFGFGTSNSPPFGFQYPTLPAGTPLDAKGGRVGANIGASGIDVNLSNPYSLNWSGQVERSIGNHMTATLGYTGSHSDKLVANYGSTAQTSYGLNINLVPGGELQNPQFDSTGKWINGVQQRLNTSFGDLTYAFNTSRVNYSAFIASVNGRFGQRGFVTASYTRSSSMDDSNNYPDPYIRSGGTSFDLNQYYSKSAWDVPNRFSLGWSYELPGFSRGNALLRRLTTGYSLNGTTILQSGNPFTVTAPGGQVQLVGAGGEQLTSANYQAQLAAGTIQFAPKSGDYGLDGTGFSYPDVTSYSQKTDRRSYEYHSKVDVSPDQGVIKSTQFAAPALKVGGTIGNEKPFSFRNPGYADTDLVAKKLTSITERFKLELRGEAYNLFNRVNLGGVDTNLGDAGTPGFGKTGGLASPPRVLVVAARIIF